MLKAYLRGVALVLQSPQPSSSLSIAAPTLFSRSIASNRCPYVSKATWIDW
jgi:hypothetical protein